MVLWPGVNRCESEKSDKTGGPGDRRFRGKKGRKRDISVSSKVEDRVMDEEAVVTEIGEI